MRVLIADDNRLLLEGIRRALEPVEDIEIVGATHTGSQVLPLVERRRPNLVAVEYGMRGADGRRCLELLREQHPDIKVVVLSASSAHDDIRLALTSGARAAARFTRRAPAATRHTRARNRQARASSGLAITAVHA